MRFDRFIFQEYSVSPSSLGIFRILYAVSILAIYLPQGLWIASFPSSFFNPPIGLTIFFAGFPPALFFIVLNCFSVLAACLLLVGYRTRLASVALAVLLLVGNSWSYSFGKINNDIFLILMPLVLLFSGWGDTYSFDARQKSSVHPGYNAWPLAFLALLVGFAMMTAAQIKVRTGWLDPNTHAVLGHVLRNVYVTGRTNWITKLVLRIHSGAFWEFLDYATIIMEASFLFAVGSRRAFRIACAFACFFHLGIALTMQIPFWPNVLAYGAFCDWSALESRVSVKKALVSWTTLLARLSPLKIVLSGIVLSVIYLTLGNPLLALASSFSPEPERIIALPHILIGAMIAAIFLAGEFRKGASQGSVLELHPVILFDGYCGLCNYWVDFVLKHDHQLRYRFTPLQSTAGQDTLVRLHMPKDFTHSVVLVEGDRSYCRSSAILRILRDMGLPFSLAYAFVLVPRQIRDRVYTFVADHRFRWFGKRNICRVPTPEERGRFL